MNARDAIVPALLEMIVAVRAAVPRVLDTARRRPRAGARAAGHASGTRGAAGAGATSADVAGDTAENAGAGVASTPTAAPSADATEAVHDYRVALRRLRTVLRALRGPWPKKRLRSIGDALKQFADATGTLRDEEVLAETLADLQLAGEARGRVDAWAARRQRHQRGLRARAVRGLREDAARAQLGGRAAKGTLEHTLGRLEKVLRDERRARRPLLEVATAALDKAHEQLGLPWRPREDEDVARSGKEVDLAALDASDAEAMHTLRIRFKRLRYTAELFGPLLEKLGTETDTGGRKDEGARNDTDARTGTGTDPGRAGTLAAEVPRISAAGVAADAKHAAKMQKRLGELHDIDVALQRIGRAWGLDAATRTALAEALRSARERSARKALDELAGWKRRSPK